MVRRVTLALFAVLFAVTGLVMAGSADARAAAKTNTESTVPAWAWTKTWDRCEFEDSYNCAWNARRDGNGIGTSFIATSKKRIIEIRDFEAYRLTHPFIRPIFAP